MQDLLERFSVNVARLHRDRRLNHYEAELTQVGEEDPDNTERQVHVRSDIHHCRRRQREMQHRIMLWTELAQVRGPGLGRDYRSDQVEGLTRVPGAATGHRVRADHRPGLRIEPP